MPVKRRKQQKGPNAKKSSTTAKRMVTDCCVLLDKIDPLLHSNSCTPKVNSVEKIKQNETFLQSSSKKFENASCGSVELFNLQEGTNGITCSPCKVPVDHMPTDLMHTSKPLEKQTEFNYSFTDSSRNSLSTSTHSFAASKFYRGKPFIPLQKRLLNKRNVSLHPDKVKVTPVIKKGQNKRKVAKPKKKLINKAKKLPSKQENRNSVSHHLEEDLNNDEKEDPALAPKFFTARSSVQSREKVFTTALAWKKGVHVVKSGSTISVKSEPLVKKAVRHPRVRLVPILKQTEDHKLLKSVENVTDDMGKLVAVPETIEEKVEPKRSKCIIIRIASPSINPAKEVEPSCSPEELPADCDNKVADDDAVSPLELALLKNEAKENLAETGDAKLYPMFRQGIRKKQRHEKIVYSSTPKIEKPFSLKHKTFFKETKDNDGKEQMIIDAGQREIGAKHCPTCNMVYALGDAKDEKMHLNYHEQFLTNLKFPGWKREHVLGEYLDGRVIMITKEDRKHMLKKIEEVVYIVNRDLGFPDLGLPSRPNATFLLFISNDKKVVGCLIAESISQASRVVLDTSSENAAPCLPNRDAVENGTDHQKGIWCCGSETVKVICGINRIWTAPSHRRQRIASRMVDCLRGNFVYGYVISTDEMAFSDPSLDGREFAAAYTKTSFFLVYK